MAFTVLGGQLKTLYVDLLCNYHLSNYSFMSLWCRAWCSCVLVVVLQCATFLQVWKLRKLKLHQTFSCFYKIDSARLCICINLHQRIIMLPDCFCLLCSNLISMQMFTHKESECVIRPILNKFNRLPQLINTLYLHVAVFIGQPHCLGWKKVPVFGLWYFVRANWIS